MRTGERVAKTRSPVQKDIYMCKRLVSVLIALDRAIDR